MLHQTSQSSSSECDKDDAELDMVWCSPSHSKADLRTRTRTHTHTHTHRGWAKGKLYYMLKWAGFLSWSSKGSLWSHVHATQGGYWPCRLLGPPQGPDVRLPKILTFRRGDAAARAVIGPLTKTRRKTINDHDYVEASAGSLALRERGTIKSP